MKQNSLMIVWISIDRKAAIDMALLYARDSLINGWWGEVELILWGPCVEAAAQDETLQQELALLRHVGVRISVCLACAVRYGVSQKLHDLGFEVRGMGEHLTERLKGDTPVLFV